MEVQLQTYYDQQKQAIFEAFHPSGTAKSITVHDVSLNWKDGHSRPTANDIQDFTVRFTIYLTSPLHDDGFTKATFTYDAEARRYIRAQVLATNGITKGDTVNAVGAALGAILQYQAEKAGAEKAARDYLYNQ